MIISKPKRTTIFSLVVFTVICGFGALFFLRQILSDPEGTWRYIVFGILVLTTTILLSKLLFGYKVIKISHDKVHIYYPFRFFKTVQDIGNLGAWEETIINTNKTEFRQLKLIFLNKGYVKLSNQENSDYDKVYNYIKRKAPKKEAKD